MKPHQKLTFAKLADAAAYALGSEAAFASAIALIGLWLLLGPSSRYSDRWELLINTVTNLVTFLMVFLLQNTQNRDTQQVNERFDHIEEVLRRMSSSKIYDATDPGNRCCRTRGTYRHVPAASLTEDTFR